MEPSIAVKETWLTRPPHPQAGPIAASLVFLLFSLSFAFFNDRWDAADWMPASPDAVFARHEYWRAWTSLFAHADLGHLLGNALLFVPFAYVLAARFGGYAFPLAGIALGGVTNLLVLRTLPAQASLIGISGVVNWLGAAWLTLFCLIDRRIETRRRFATAMFLTLVLFVPDQWRPEVSYLSHVIGFASGAACGGIYYLVCRRRIQAAEVREYVYDDDAPAEAPAGASEAREGLTPTPAP